IIYTAPDASGSYSPSTTYIAREDGSILTGNEYPNPVRMAIQIDIKVEIIGANADDTFYFTLNGINQVRSTTAAFNEIYGANENIIDDTYIGWNERAHIETDNLFIPSGFTSNIYSSATGQYDIYPTTSGTDGSYTTGFASLTSSGITSTIWSAAGSGWLSNGGTTINRNNATMKVMPGNISHTITSSSGEHGRVDTNLQGTVTTPSSALTKAASTGVDILNIPHGKTVTYTLTPDAGYIIDTLTVDGVKVAPTPVRNTAGKIEYYTYTFNGDSTNHTIDATWQKSVDIEADITWIDDTNAYSSRPPSTSMQIYQNGTPYGDAVTITNDDMWKYSFYDLPRYDSSGDEYTYSIEQVFPNTTPFQYTYTSSIDTAANEPKTLRAHVTNTLTQATLNINTQVTGDLADENDSFTTTIQLGNTSNSSISLKPSDGTYHITVPVGISYSITQTAPNGYITTFTDTSGLHESNNASGIILASGNDITFTHTRNIPPATGVSISEHVSIVFVLIGIFLLLSGFVWEYITQDLRRRFA
ncbi:MAG: Cna B-type domain-containing protein, partial [Actinomycetaceae bacterium]|nr:Cna B-type domain-containing protein [Actinomycetaceae bacterium]